MYTIFLLKLTIKTKLAVKKLNFKSFLIQNENFHQPAFEQFWEI